METSADIDYSVLDLCPIGPGGTAADAFRESLDLAQHVERWGYRRFWVAEHHNIPGVASAATAVLIGYLAGGTSTIRVGAGGIMLPNHPPLLIAEQFGTLASLYPDRIDLGLGRAPGGDLATIYALRRDPRAGDAFPDDLRELMDYFQPGGPGRGVHAVPGEGIDVPMYILGSSDFGARVAAEFGLPYAFASHFAPDYLDVALDLYGQRFRPSPKLAEPYAMVAANVVAAETDAEARRLFTSIQQQFLNLVRGTPSLLPPPVDSMEGRWNSVERARVERMTEVSIVGSLDTVKEGLAALVSRTAANEIIVVAHIFDHAARLRSFEITSAAMQSLASPPGIAKQHRGVS